MIWWLTIFCLDAQHRFRSTFPTSADLFKLVQNADLEHVEASLNAGVDPKVVNAETGQTLIHTLAKGNTHQREANMRVTGMVYRDVEVPRLFVGLLLILVLRGVKINKRDKLGRTAIHIAAQQGTPGFLRALVQRGAKTDVIDAKGRSIMHYAAKNTPESIEAVFSFVRRPGNLVSVPDKQLMTPIGYACMHGNEHVLSTFLAVSTGNINHQDAQKHSYLHLAIMFKRYELLGLLKSYKCDVFLQDLNGHTVLHQLALDTRPNHQVTTGWNALIDSLSDDDVKKLVNMKDAKGRTVLHICALHQNEELVRLLFNKLPAEDVHIQPDSSGYTAFHLAISRPSEKVCRLLIDNKDPNTLVQPDSKGRSVLHWLASYGCHTLSGLWTEDKLFNVEPAIMTTEKMFDAANHSPLHIAAEKNDPDAITAMLLRFPSSKSLLDKRNRSPIHIAALYGSVEALTALLEGGWDVNALDNKLRTPLIDASRKGKYGAVLELIKYGANVEHRDRTNLSALEHASQLGSQSVLAVFVGKEKYTLDQLGEVLNRFSPNADDLKKDVVQILNTFDNIEDIVDGNDGSSSGYTDTDEVDHSDDEGDNTHESDATHSSGTESDGPFEEKNDDDWDDVEPKRDRKSRGGPNSAKDEDGDSDGESITLSYGDFTDGPDPSSSSSSSPSGSDLEDGEIILDDLTSGRIFPPLSDSERLKFNSEESDDEDFANVESDEEATEQGVKKQAPITFTSPSTAIPTTAVGGENAAFVVDWKEPTSDDDSEDWANVDESPTKPTAGSVRDKFKHIIGMEAGEPLEDDEEEDNNQVSPRGVHTPTAAAAAAVAPTGASVSGKPHPATNGFIPASVKPQPLPHNTHLSNDDDKDDIYSDEEDGAKNGEDASSISSDDSWAGDDEGQPKAADPISAVKPSDPSALDALDEFLNTVSSDEPRRRLSFADSLQVKDDDVIASVRSKYAEQEELADIATRLRRLNQVYRATNATLDEITAEYKHSEEGLQNGGKAIRIPSTEIQAEQLLRYEAGKANLELARMDRKELERVKKLLYSDLEQKKTRLWRVEREHFLEKRRHVYQTEVASYQLKLNNAGAVAGADLFSLVTGTLVVLPALVLVVMFVYIVSLQGYQVVAS